MVGGIPQAAGIVLGVILVALILDRRELTDLGLKFERGGWRRTAGGLVLGLGISTFSIAAGVAVGFYEITGIQLTGGPAVWILLVLGTALSQLLIVIAEELFVRGYIITNSVEGLDGVPSIPRGVAVSVAILIASLFFYFTHAARGSIFGIMAGGLAILLGVAYVLSGDLFVPIGIHFGVNFAGMVGGWAPQQATLVQISSSTTVAESLILPQEAVVAQLLGTAIGIGLLFWWYTRLNGQARVASSITRPTLRWNQDKDATVE